MIFQNAKQASIFGHIASILQHQTHILALPFNSNSSPDSERLLKLFCFSQVRSVRGATKNERIPIFGRVNTNTRAEPVIQENRIFSSDSITRTFFTFGTHSSPDKSGNNQTSDTYDMRVMPRIGQTQKFIPVGGTQERSNITAQKCIKYICESNFLVSFSIKFQQ